MKVHQFLSSLAFLLLINCASTNEVVYDFNLETDFNKYDTYVLCVDDFFVEHSEHPNLDNKKIRNLLANAVALEMENKAHRTNVLNPQLQAGFRILISEETAEFKNCEHSKDLEYWESCTIHEKTYQQETLVVYVADFKTSKVLWHASIICNLDKPKGKLRPYAENLVKELFATYPKVELAKFPDQIKETY